MGSPFLIPDLNDDERRRAAELRKRIAEGFNFYVPPITMSAEPTLDPNDYAIPAMTPSAMAETHGQQPPPPLTRRPATAAAYRGEEYGPPNLENPKLFGNNPLDIMTGPPRPGGLTPTRETQVLPLGSVSVDKSQGLGGQAWIDSQRNQNQAAKPWLGSDDPQPRGDKMLDDLIAAPQLSVEGPLVPGSERTLFSAGGTLGQLLGDIQAQRIFAQRDEAEAARSQNQKERDARAALLDMLIADPFAEQRLKGNLAVQAAVEPYRVRGQEERTTEMDRREAYQAELNEIQADYLEKRETLARSGDRQALDALENAYRNDVAALDKKFGIGARISSQALYQPDFIG